MTFYPDDAPVPEALRTAAFVLRPLRATDNALDYDAVMATQETLRQRGSGEWPRPDFTLAENLADLEGHEADFQKRRGFTYTVLKPDETRCLGCVYIYPRQHNVQRLAGDVAAADIGVGEALIWFWVRPDGIAEGLDRQLLHALVPWLRTDFAFPRVVFLAWEIDERQTALLRDAGLEVIWSHPVAETRALHFDSFA